MNDNEITRSRFIKVQKYSIKKKKKRNDSLYKLNCIRQANIRIFYATSSKVSKNIQTRKDNKKKK